MFNLFKKKNDDFHVDRQVGNYVWYDASRREFKFNGKKTVSQDNIKGYLLKYGNKTYSRKDLGSVLVGGALFGVVGVLAAKTNVDEEISNITIQINLKDGNFIFLPLTIGKMKASKAKPIIETAEKIIRLLDEV